MGKVKTSGYPVMDLIIYRNRAMNDGHWLEAIVLTHMFIETQLRIACGLDPIRESRNPPKGEKVIKLAKEALIGKKIDEKLFKEIESFNTIRNDAVHNLALGAIKYDQLEQIAINSDKLISELQKTYVHVMIMPEQKIK